LFASDVLDNNERVERIKKSGGLQEHSAHQLKFSILIVFREKIATSIILPKDITHLSHCGVFDVVFIWIE